MNIQAPLIIDIEGFALTAVDKKRLQNPLTAGIILFGRNWQSRAQLTALCTAIKAIRKDLLICVDHEGGRVQRFRTDGFTHLPAMRRLGQMWAQDGKGLEGEGVLKACQAASAVGFLLASELRACGVDFSFTPELDLDYGPRLPPRPQTRQLVGQKPHARFASRWHGQLRQTFSWTWICQGRLARRHAHRQAQFESHLKRRCQALCMAEQ